MNMKNLCALTLVGTTGLWIVACPPAGGDDAGSKDSTVVDAVVADDTGNTTVDSGCSNPTPCGDITPIGECSGSTLRYCDDNCLFEKDCAQEAGGPYSCGMIGSFHDCLAGAGQACEPDYWGCDPATNCTGNYPCDPEAQLNCVQEVCVGGNTDAGADDTHVPDVFTDDTAIDDAGINDVNATDTQTPDLTGDDTFVDDATIDDVNSVDTTTEDAGVIGDSGQSTDMTAVEDAGIEDAGSEDAA